MPFGDDNDNNLFMRMFSKKTAESIRGLAYRVYGQDVRIIIVPDYNEQFCSGCACVVILNEHVRR